MNRRPIKVLCPKCMKSEMTVVLIEPMKPGDRMDETTYRCPRCGNELKLAAKRRPSATEPPSGITIDITAEVDPDTPRPPKIWPQ